MNLSIDKQAILRKIASLKRCIDRIEAKIPETSEKLQTDYDSQDIVFSVSTTNLNDFRQFSKEIVTWMNK